MWNLYKNEKFLEPLKFSNGKTQEDVVNEVVKEIKNGAKVIFIHGVCGTGKSAIALNIAKELGKTSIVVPGKNLQSQYKKDYENEKYLLKEGKEKLKISVLTGRKNHRCRFLEENKNAIPIFTKEINLKLNELFEKKRGKMDDDFGNDGSADNLSLPCKIEIKEKNWNKIKEYLKQNNRVNWKDFDEIKDVKRASIAPVCPYWSPILPSKYELKIFEAQNKKEYMGLSGKKFFVYKGKPGCKFYEQYDSYINSDVMVFNAAKYKLEVALDRKPLTEVEIIDECDEFLDSFANQKNINLDRLTNSLINGIGVSDELDSKISEVGEIIKQIKLNKKTNDLAISRKVVPLKETGMYDLVHMLVKNSDFVYELEDESYLVEVMEGVLNFENSLDETYVSFEKKENTIIASLITTNLEKKFAELLRKNKVLVLMSGTVHSESVLKNIFGINDYKRVEAETIQQGNIDILKTGFEMDCKYSNFSSGKFSREDYLIALDKCVEKSKQPTLVHVNAFQDLPSEEELIRFNLKNLISREKLSEMQTNDSEGELIGNFKNKKVDVLFSTRCARGVDFPGDECNSIVFTKYPNPNVQDPFWKVLMETKANYYWDFYRDKAHRELLQKIYRGLRFKNDHIYLLSPDERVLNEFEK